MTTLPDTDPTSCPIFPTGHFLFADTETTGLPAKGEYGNPAHPDTPHLVELAGILCDIDGNELTRLHRIIRPDFIPIPKEASDVHGITQERALQEGVPLWLAMWEFDRLIGNAKALVFHNHQFDRLILKAAHLRLGLPHRFRSVQRLCTMKQSTPIVALPKMKWPRLMEAYQHFFGETFEGAHGAIADAEACKRVFFRMNPPATQV